MDHPSGKASDHSRTLRLAARVAAVMTVLAPVVLFLIGLPIIPPLNPAAKFILLCLAILTTTTLFGAAEWARRERQPHDVQRAAALRTAAKVACVLVLVCVLLCLLMFWLIEFADYA
jgi:hypothetical protein